MPVFYDIVADDWREATQADVDRWVTCVAAFGMLVTFLRKTDRPVPADLAVEVAQGKASITDGFARFAALLEHTP